MGRPIPVKLGNESFATKGDLETRIRSLIAVYPLSGFVEGEDKNLCLDLFEYHPRHREKCGLGIVAVQVLLDDKHGTRCFYIHTIGNRIEDISWTKCVAAIK